MIDKGEDRRLRDEERNAKSAPRSPFALDARLPSRFALLASLFVLAGCMTQEGGSDRSASRPAGTDGIDGNEWTSWRGPENSGVSRATGLIDHWNSEQDNVLWKQPLGGRSTPIVMNGKVFVIRLTGDHESWQEEVVCLDAFSGEILWRHAFDIFHSDIASDRVGWTSVAGDPETGYVYAHGVQGHFFCFDEDGNVIWHRSLGEEVGAFYRYGGRTHTPVVDGDLVIVSFLSSSLGDQGRGMHRYLAMNKRTGEVVWWSAPGRAPLDTTFGVPAVAVVNGVRQLIGGNGDGWIYGMKIATGEKIWGFQLSKRGINSSVVVRGNRVYVSHSEDNIDTTAMGRFVCIDPTGEGDVTQTHEVWRREGFGAEAVAPVLVGDRLFAVNKGGELICLDAETGEEHWSFKAAKEAWGSPVWADGKLYLPEVRSKFHIIEAGENEARLLSTIEFTSSERMVDLRGAPAIAYGRIYVMTREMLYCLGSADYEPTPIVISPLPDTGPADAVAASVQVVPGEVQVSPGSEVRFTARLFDARGRLIEEVRQGEGVNWTLSGLRGTITGNGVFTADPSVNGQFGTLTVTARSGEREITNSARIRILPNLPFSEDFENIGEGDRPTHWIGATPVKYRTVIEDGNHIFQKTSDLPQFWRSYALFGASTLSEYTITADVRGALKRRSQPDIGLVNSRYLLELRGNDQQLRIVSWVPMPRVVQSIDFTVDPDVWYTMKFRVDYEGDRGIVRGKVWTRGEPEPAGWTIELEDSMPHREGSPGIACYSMADIFFDNISVVKY